MKDFESKNSRDEKISEPDPQQQISFMKNIKI